MKQVNVSTIKVGDEIERPIKVSKFRTLYDTVKVASVTRDDYIVTVEFIDGSKEVVGLNERIHWYALND